MIYARDRRGVPTETRKLGLYPRTASAPDFGIGSIECGFFYRLKHKSNYDNRTHLAPGFPRGQFVMPLCGQFDCFSFMEDAKYLTITGRVGNKIEFYPGETLCVTCIERAGRL